MPHLYKFRQGWQSENLARFLLSEIAFIAQPSTVADDVGSDFYCTLFRREQAGQNQHLIPQDSFVIQIKSSGGNLDLSDKAPFLKQLELPFFLGIVDRKELSMEIFSGRALHLLFTMRGLPNKLVVNPAPLMPDKNYYEIVNEDQKHFNLKFPLVAKLSAKDLDAASEKIFSVLSAECSLIYQNIASRQMSEYILTFGEDDVRIFAGSGSAQRFRHNLCLRLAEAFYNLEWILQMATPEFSETEFNIYREAWEKIRPYCSAWDQAFVDKIRDRLAGAVAALPNTED